MTTKHTPGPWTAGNGGPLKDWPEVSANGKVIARLFDLNTEADARLVAAAPELLAACSALLKAHDYDAIETVKHMAIDAIAKAEGGAP